MTRYLISPVGNFHGSLAWADTLEKAQEIRFPLQAITGLRWTITR